MKFTLGWWQIFMWNSIMYFSSKYGTETRLKYFIHVYAYTCVVVYVYMYIYVTEKAMAPHSSTLAWIIPWTEEPGGLQPMGSLRVGHDWATSFSLFIFMHWRRKWQPTPVFLPEESQGREAWWAVVYGVTQSRTRLKWLSSSSIYMYIYVCTYSIYIYVYT